MTAILDASAFAPVVIADERTNMLPGLLEALSATSGMIVPPHWRAEVTNMLLVASRKGRMTSDGLAGAIATIDAVIIEVDPISADRLLDASWVLAERHRLTIYDAAYLELAIRRSLPLATHDAALIAAARRESVELFAQ